MDAHSEGDARKSAFAAAAKGESEERGKEDAHGRARRAGASVGRIDKTGTDRQLVKDV